MDHDPHLPADITYRVNDRDEIIYVNEAWDRFAEANAGQGITSEQILGRRLWDFITDPTTRELYRQVLSRTRDARPVRFNFRCDSPDCRRLLVMDAERREDGTVEFRTRTLLQESREPVPLLAANGTRSGELVRVCGWCKRVFVGGAWEDVEVAVERLQLFEHAILPSLTHGICDACYARLMDTLDHA